MPETRDRPEAYESEATPECVGSSVQEEESVAAHSGDLHKSIEKLALGEPPNFIDMFD